MAQLIPITQQNSPVLTTANGDLHIGIIGCGYWGPKLARNFRELPGTTLTVVSDLREDRLLELKSLFPEVTITRDSDLLLNSTVDAVVIATPVHTHYALARQALLAGKHVFIEKPITTNSDQAQELVNLSTMRNLTLMVGHTFVYNPAVEAVKQIVCSGESGSDLLHQCHTRKPGVATT